MTNMLSCSPAVPAAFVLPPLGAGRVAVTDGATPAPVSLLGEPPLPVCADPNGAPLATEDVGDGLGDLPANQSDSICRRQAPLSAFLQHHSAPPVGPGGRT
jgi:hypothetical protein